MLGTSNTPQDRGNPTGAAVCQGLIGRLRELCGFLPDSRREGNNTRYSMVDAAMAAFSCFYMQSPSFLAHQRHLAEHNGRGRSNCQALFGVKLTPSDNTIRSMLDPVSPALFDPMFERTFDSFEASGSLLDFRSLGDHVLIALDGTEYFCSQKLSCSNCSHRKRSNGTVEHFHSFVAATLLAPGLKYALPLQPEFVVPQDGHDKQDCENRAGHRWFAKHGERYRHLKPIYLGDDLYAHQPICEAVKAAGGNFIFVCKPSSHKIVSEYLTGVQLSELTIKHKDHRGKRVTHHFRWLSQVPLREGADAMKVDWFDFEIRDANGKTTYYNSFVTDLTVEAGNVAEIAACGRTRWKIENEAFNVLKTKGYNLEHNFGHGKHNLAALLAVLNLLAFAFHTICDLSDVLWKRARRGRTRNEFFRKLDFLTSLMLIQSWHQLLTIMVEGLPPPAPA